MPKTGIDTEIDAGYCMEDFSVGQNFTTEPITITQEDIITFAQQYDPQDFHIDPEKAKKTVAGTLIASGWHTACLSMRMLVKAVPKIKGGMMGRTIEKMNWQHPVYPDDTLTLTTTVLHIRASASKPDRGIMRIQNTVCNQNDTIVLDMETVIILPRRG